MKNFSKDEFVIDLDEMIDKIRNNHELLAFTIASMASIFEYSDDAIIGIDNDGIILSWNSGAKKMYHYSAEEIIGKKISILIPAECPDDLDDIIKRIIDEPNVYKFESLRKTKDEDTLDVSVIITPVKDSKNKINGMSMIERDITKLKRAEDALKKSEEKYRLLFGEDLTGDFIATSEGEILECNPAFANIYGFDDSESAKGYMISQFNLEDWGKLIDDLRVDRKIHSHQTIHKRLDGELIHVVANMVGMFDESGVLSQIKGYVFDDTERKEAEDALRESEEKYRLLFDEDLTGDFIATPDGRILECNPAYAEIYGFKDSLSAKGYMISQFNLEDWGKLIDDLRVDRKIHSHQTIHKRLDGELIHVVANIIGIFDESGVLSQIKGYVFDDTERKEAEDALRESEEKYRLLFDEDLTGDFIATPDGRILECNPAYAEMYGFNTIERALTFNISKFNTFDWPYMITRLKQERKIYGFQSWQRRSDGLRIHVVSNLVGIFDDSNELIRVKGYVFDDTERKQAEDEIKNARKQMKEILESIKDGFFALSQTWVFTYVNKCAGDYLGQDPDDLIGQNIWEMIPGFIGTTCETNFRKSMDSQEIQHFTSPAFKNSEKKFDFSVYPSSDGISVYWREITK